MTELTDIAAQEGQNLPESTLTQLSQYFVIGDLGTPSELMFRPLMSDGEALWRNGGAAAAGVWQLNAHSECWWIDRFAGVFSVVPRDGGCSLGDDRGPGISKFCVCRRNEMRFRGEDKKKIENIKVREGGDFSARN